MVDIPRSVQDLLKCDECDELLSCGPVFVMHDTGETVCGRCSPRQQLQVESENREKTRNIKYEAAAKLLRFPCTYAEQGCPELMNFSTEQPNNHELNCEHRRFFCPMEPGSQCNWVGSWKNFKAHCRDEHSPQLLSNPCNAPKPDLTNPNLSTYLITAFNFLFLLHVKVSSGKLFHSVRMFGDAKYLHNFAFNFIVEGNDVNFSKFGSVLPAHSLNFQESSAVSTKVNLLLEMLNAKYHESRFTIKIVVKKCFYCSKNLECFSDAKWCRECEEKIARCKYHEEGCLFADYTKNAQKCLKHAMFFCEYPSMCFLCNADLAGGSIFEHFEASGTCRKIIRKCSIGAVVRVTPNASSEVDYILFSSGGDTIAVVTCMLKNGTLEIWLRSPHPSHELMNFGCSVVLTDPETKYTETITPRLTSDEEHDWGIKMNTERFPAWGNLGIDLEVNISNLTNSEK